MVITRYPSASEREEALDPSYTLPGTASMAAAVRCRSSPPKTGVQVTVPSAGQSASGSQACIALPDSKPGTARKTQNSRQSVQLSTPHNSRKPATEGNKHSTNCYICKRKLYHNGKHIQHRLAVVCRNCNKKWHTVRMKRSEDPVPITNDRRGDPLSFNPLAILHTQVDVENAKLILSNEQTELAWRKTHLRALEGDLDRYSDVETVYDCIVVESVPRPGFSASNPTSMPRSLVVRASPTETDTEKYARNPCTTAGPDDETRSQQSSKPAATKLSDHLSRLIILKYASSQSTRIASLFPDLSHISDLAYSGKAYISGTTPTPSLKASKSSTDLDKSYSATADQLIHTAQLACERLLLPSPKTPALQSKPVRHNWMDICVSTPDDFQVPSRKHSIRQAVPTHSAQPDSTRPEMVEGQLSTSQYVNQAGANAQIYEVGMDSTVNRDLPAFCGAYEPYCNTDIQNLVVGGDLTEISNSSSFSKVSLTKRCLGSDFTSSIGDLPLSAMNASKAPSADLARNKRFWQVEPSFQERFSCSLQMPGEHVSQIACLRKKDLKTLIRSGDHLSENVIDRYLRCLVVSSHTARLHGKHACARRLALINTIQPYTFDFTNPTSMVYVPIQVATKWSLAVMYPRSARQQQGRVEVFESSQESTSTSVTSAFVIDCLKYWLGDRFSPLEWEICNNQRPWKLFSDIDSGVSFLANAKALAFGLDMVDIGSNSESTMIRWQIAHELVQGFVVPTFYQTEIKTGTW